MLQIGSKYDIIVTIYKVGYICLFLDLRSK